MDSAEGNNDVRSVPVVDFSGLRKDSRTKSLVIQQIHRACSTAGIFHVINHGISGKLIQEALNVNAGFFDLPLTSKRGLISDDTNKPVRFSANHGAASGFSREFLKLYAHPFDDFVSSWPTNPPDYQEKMGRLTVEMRKLGIETLGAIMESLNLEATYLKGKIEQGMYMVIINSYPPNSASNMDEKIGATPHTDHSLITILVQNSPGLEVMAPNCGTFGNVFPEIKGSVQVLVGDHLEVLSNGKYKAVMHRVIHTSCDKTRLSIAGFLSLGMDEVVDPVPELVDDDHPRQYKGSSLRDFLNHLASGKSVPFLDTLKIQSATWKD